jgi:hypothetical protein
VRLYPRSEPLQALHSARVRVYPPRLPCGTTKGHLRSEIYQQRYKHKPETLSLTWGFCSKRKGLDKAFFQIEQALKKAKSADPNAEDSKALRGLQHLLSRAEDSTSPEGSRLRQQTREPSAYSSDDDEGTDNTPDSNAYLAQHRSGSLTIDDAENPLQLLARASNLQLSPSSRDAVLSQSEKPNGQHHQPRHDEDLEIQSFFTSVYVNLDVGEDIDPISIGLATEAEAEELFT